MPCGSVKYVVGSDRMQALSISSGPSDLLQVPGLVGVYASMSRQVNGKSVEALNQTNGIGFRMVALKHWQPDGARESS